MTTQEVSESECVVPALERVAAVMQVEPELWLDGITMSTNGGSVQVGMHGHPWDAVHELLNLLEVDATPLEAWRLTNPTSGRDIWLKFGDHRYREGTVSLIWFISRSDAELAFGQPLIAQILRD